MNNVRTILYYMLKDLKRYYKKDKFEQLYLSCFLPELKRGFELVKIKEYPISYGNSIDSMYKLDNKELTVSLLKEILFNEKDNLHINFEKIERKIDSNIAFNLLLSEKRYFCDEEYFKTIFEIYILKEMDFLNKKISIENKEFMINYYPFSEDFIKYYLFFAKESKIKINEEFVFYIHSKIEEINSFKLKSSLNQVSLEEIKMFISETKQNLIFWFNILEKC